MGFVNRWSRLAFLLSFALFWGGLTFYTGFVVRIAHDVLSDPMDGGMITQRVTVLLQILGGVTAVMMLWNAWQVGRQSRAYGFALTVCLAVLCASLIGLVFVHHFLDRVIDIKTAEITDREAFENGHRHYSQLTAIEWVASLAYLSITVEAWRKLDRRAGD